MPEPLLPGVAPTVKRFNSAGVEVGNFRGPEIEIRALVEGQALCMRAALEAQLGPDSSKTWLQKKLANIFKPNSRLWQENHRHGRRLPKQKHPAGFLRRFQRTRFHPGTKQEMIWNTEI